ncbi:MAG TPA: hypothetical protein VFA85_02270 [Terriglobales bacterium]|nr:hypothetical protein [Terriglobales bacterium]
MDLARILFRKGALMLAVSFLIWQHPGYAQQDNPQANSSLQNSEDQQISGNQKTADQHESSDPAVPVVAGNDTTLPIHQVGVANALRETISPLRWGPFYISSAQFMQANDRLAGINGTQSDSEQVSMLSTTLVFDKQYQNSRIALQYNPNIAVDNGQLYTNFTSQLLTFDTQMNLTSRWTFGISDSFVASQNQNLLINNYFSVDPLTNTTLQGQIFNNAGRMITDSAQLRFGYALSPQTTLTLAPNYAYNDMNELGNVLIGNQYGSGLVLTHSTARGDTFGLNYAYQVTQISGQPTVKYNTMGFSYGRKLTLRWTAAGNAAAVYVTSAAPNTNYWTASGALQLIRTMNRSTFALSLLREQGLSQVIINGSSNRADALYTVNWTPRFSSTLGAGYFVAQQAGGNYTGKYGVSTLQYLLTPSISVLASYSHQYQFGVAQILAGTTNIIVGGLRWEPALPH